MPSLSSEIEFMLEFVDDTGSSAFPHIPDIEGEIWDRFDVTRQRTYVYLNDDGTWIQAGYGSLDADVQALIDR